MSGPVLNNESSARLASYFPDFAPYITAQTPRKCVKRVGKHDESMLYELLKMAKQNKERWAVDSDARSLVRSAYLFVKKNNPDLNDSFGELKRYSTQTGLAVGLLPENKSNFLREEMQGWFKNCKRKIKVLSRERGRKDPEVVRLKDSREVIEDLICQLYYKQDRFFIAIDASGILQGVAQARLHHNIREIRLLTTNPNNLAPLEAPYDGPRKVNGVGSSLIAHISRISKHNSKELELNSYRSARTFYEHLGFERKGPCRRVTYYRLSLEQENELRERYLYHYTAIRDMSSVLWVRESRENN